MEKSNMKVFYTLTIQNPEQHHVRVTMRGTFSGEGRCMTVFMPSWSPGSYLMREYARHLRGFRALNLKGDYLAYEQVDKGAFLIRWPDGEEREFEIMYDVFCHEISVRTSYVDIGHAFLHLPTLLMGIEDVQLIAPELRLNFPPLWSTVSTGLEDISPKREIFLYRAQNFDQLLDCPIEIGCHQTDGFMFKNIPHELAFYGEMLPNQHPLKKDIETIVTTVANTMGEVPYGRYVFITHLASGIYGGLEHHNSTALHFDGARLVERKGYIKWLSLVAHEYFHAWNVKRIRPKEFGPFNYRQEGYTQLLWLAEGLTSFMDELFVLRSGLIALEEYLDLQKNNFKSYMAIPGRRFHSLADSSFNAWIKLYRPDENSANSSISYYLKGGLAFFILNILLKEKGKGINDFLAQLWLRYKERPEVGLEAEEVYQMIEVLGGPEVREKFEMFIVTTEELPLQSSLERMGLAWVEERPEAAYFGIKTRSEGERIFVSSVVLDGPAFKFGLNAGDEILFVGGQRVTRGEWDDFGKNLLPNQAYELLVARMGRMVRLTITLDKSPAELKEIKIVDREKALKFLN
ncbi:MAG: hypothetical protein A2X86_15785 [Bdellovibrionales bacterium GWA2_49_15]|nr:MAG: hypothetical protein A2X86_15785 [Bdellovibrionales bacterium GWA2_49_15]HAZ12397.1 hypothetical protein [Bdellovibrionales bacterium]